MIEFDIDPDSDEFVNYVYDEDGELVSEYRGDSAANTFKHALYDQRPLLFAELFSDYFEWKENHKHKLVDAEDDE